MTDSKKIPTIYWLSKIFSTLRPYFVNNAGFLLIGAMALLSAACGNKEKTVTRLSSENFEKGQGLPSGWEKEGDAGLDSETFFEGSKALRLTRHAEALNSPVMVSGPRFKVSQGAYTVSLSIKTDLVSPDNSFNGEVLLEYFDQDDKPSSMSVVEQDGQKNWRQVKKEMDIPASFSYARIKVRINKAQGNVWIDDLSVTPAASTGRDQVINRLFFDTAQMGNLLYPEDSRKVSVTVWALRPLSGQELEPHCVVRDSWGAEQNKPLAALLTESGKKDSFHVYTGTVDLSGIPLETGRYYELHATLQKQSGDPFTNYTSFAILPEAAANAYKPEEIPFTSRTWDARVAENLYLAHRLGVRIGGIWGGWSSEPPYEPKGPNIDVIEKLGMGFLTGSPAFDWEHKNDGYEKYNEEVLRKGVRSFLARYGHIKPMVINLGNEPRSRGQDLKNDIAAYRAVYTEVKKVDPSIIVVGTSVGTDEEYFKAGFGEWCDAYDFHVYEDSKNVREIIEVKYPALFKKYGHAKPIWSTELGLNSQGMARQAVATELVKKFSNFFAAGGANTSWFGIMYPDPDATIAGSFGEAHNVFDCRYNKYAPKLDALAYYNMVNAIAIKKFAGEKVYDGDIHAFLFRDRNDKELQVYYKDKGRQDSFIALPGVKDVEVIRIDGSRHSFDAGNAGITLTLNEDPVLLLYQGSKKPLAASLGKSPVRLENLPSSVVSGQSVALDAVLGADAKAELQAPPFWTVQKDQGAAGVTRFSVQSPMDSDVREADMVLQLKNASGSICGELYHRIRVDGAISMNLLPQPASGSSGAGVGLLLQNKGSVKQSLHWEVALLGEQKVEGGKYGKTTSATAYFTTPSSGTVDLAPGESQTVSLPLAGVDPVCVYRMKAIVRDSSNRQLVEERPVSGFVGVPRAQTINIDGNLDEADWKKAGIQTANTDAQFYSVDAKKRTGLWTGPDDLSATIRFLWDENYLYVGVTVKDDIAGLLKEDGNLWQQDGLQFLVDPMRTSSQKSGKYDYAFGLGAKGPQGWCYLSSDAVAPTGEVKDVKMAIRREDQTTGHVTYEFAFPWSRLAPFHPVIGANLGLTMIVNDDDGTGRDCFMTWFGNAHSKDIDTVGDLILQE